jgi:hypothetical protein
MQKNLQQLAPQLILTAAMVLVFGYFGIDKLVHPDLWIGWIPLWMEGMLTLSRNAWLTIIGLTEVLLAILLIIPIRNVRKAGAIIIALHLVAILTQVGWNELGIRDLGLLLADLALIFLL